MHTKLGFPLVLVPMYLPSIVGVPILDHPPKFIHQCLIKNLKHHESHSNFIYFFSTTLTLNTYQKLHQINTNIKLDGKMLKMLMLILLDPLWDTLSPKLDHHVCQYQNT